jgi:macrolide transport system ATP-binding/permease protein
MATPLLQLRGITRTYGTGENALTVLKDVDLDIAAGEMIAIIGPSGSGKSTLMNIIGCLDRATAGRYLIDGRDMAEMDSDALAALRRDRFGFIFQRYQLLPDLDAMGNVEVPAIYAGIDAGHRRKRSQALLELLGLGERLHHRPSEMSGGQQQRTSIARALVNGGEVILADEPTGALDTRSGEELMTLLEALHRQGHTIIVITHEPDVAAHAQRIVEIRDGRIVADRAVAGRAAAGRTVAERGVAGRAAVEHAAAEGVAASAPPGSASAASIANSVPPVGTGSGSGWRDRFLEAFRMALSAMLAHRMRSFLTMLGIIIGIASVTSVVALAGGAKQSIIKEIGALGTNTIDIYTGEDFGDSRSGKVRTLNPRDADALSGLSYVDSVTPSVSSNATLRYGNADAQAQINGVGADYFRVRGIELAAGRFFDDAAVRALEQVVVIDHNTRERFFDDGADPIGRILLIGNMPCRVIGAAKESTGRQGGGGNLSVWTPYTTAMARLQGKDHLSNITVRVRDDVPMGAAEDAIVRLMTLRHGHKDFFTSNAEDIRKTIDRTTGVMTTLISSIALISLLVGGIGVMNIMLVSVTERTREIGVRMAVGARQSDIMQQFLIEAVVICLVGGSLGVALAMATAGVFNSLSESFKMVVSTTSIVAAFACSTAVGVIFGFLPARNAARMDPVEALSRE